MQGCAPLIPFLAVIGFTSFWIYQQPEAFLVANFRLLLIWVGVLFSHITVRFG